MFSQTCETVEQTRKQEVIMKLTSQAFENGGKIPDKYTKYGENRIPHCT